MATVKNVNVEYRQRMSRLEKAALLITNKVGSMEFFLIILTWTAIWILWNVLAPARLRFDPFPAFVLWLFISNTIQLFLTPLIMIGQNIQNLHSETRSESDYEINVKSEKEVEIIIKELGKQKEMLAEILRRLDKK